MKSFLILSLVALAALQPLSTTPAAALDLDAYLSKLQDASRYSRRHKAKLEQFQLIACHLALIGPTGISRLIEHANEGDLMALPLMTAAIEMEGVHPLLPLPVDGTEDRFLHPDGRMLTYKGFAHEPSYSISGFLGEVHSDPELDVDSAPDYIGFKRTNRTRTQQIEVNLKPGEESLLLPKQDLRAGPVLDSSCGGGALVLELAQAGYDVFGSELYLSPLMRRLPRYFAQADAFNLNLKRKFKTILSFWGPISFTEKLAPLDPKVGRLLRAFRNHLLPSGTIRIFPAADQLTRGLATEYGFNFQRISGVRTPGGPGDAVILTLK